MTRLRSEEPARRFSFLVTMTSLAWYRLQLLDWWPGDRPRYWRRHLPTLSECHNHRLAAPDAMGGSDADSVQVLNRVVKLYFGCGEAVLVAGANKCLAELAKHCTRMVCDALRAMGVDENKVELKKPEPARADGPANEARRVDVVAK